jgi:hypothetical protein
MELMTRIQSEQHSSKELVCKLTQQEDELKVLREAVSNFVILIILKYLGITQYTTALVT